MASVAGKLGHRYCLWGLLAGRVVGLGVIRMLITSLRGDPVPAGHGGRAGGRAVPSRVASPSPLLTLGPSWVAGAWASGAP